MKYLLDTCVISEMVKKVPNPKVIAWLDGCEEEKLFLSVLTIGELQKGISKLPDDNPRKEDLQQWVEHDLVERFEGRILPVDVDTAFVWGNVQGAAEQTGESLPVMDSLIAATAKAYGLAVVTRNVRDLKRCNAKTFNPWP